MYIFPNLGWSASATPVTSGLESFDRKSTPSDRPVQKWVGPKMLKSQLFDSILARELLDAVHYPACSSGASAASQTFTLTPASYTHWPRTSLHSICLTCYCRMEELIAECRGVLHGWSGGGRGDYVLYLCWLTEQCKNWSISLEKLCNFSLSNIL